MLPVRLPSAGEVRPTDGAWVSTVKPALAGLGSVLPLPSFARTSNVWEPSASAVVVNGEEQLEKAAASTRHSKVDPPSLEVNEKVGVESFVGLLGAEVIVVCGGVVSTLPPAAKAAVPFGVPTPVGPS